MKRIHCYLKEKDGLILNFVVTNTEKDAPRISFRTPPEHRVRSGPKLNGKILNVRGDVLAANQIE
jgi:hypothetical protein